MKRWVAAAGVAGTTVLSAAATGVASAGSAPPPSAVSEQVRLVTGELVGLRPSTNGRSRIVLGRDAVDVSVLAAAGHRYAQTPMTVFYGRFLDPELFDLDRLAALGSDARVPVNLTDAPAAVPGVTVTGRSGHTTTGYVAASSAATFAAAVRAQYRRDRAAGAARPTTLLGAHRIALDVPTTPAASPNYPQVTVQVKVLDDAGQPVDFAYVSASNTDDARRYGQFFAVVDGVARISVPVGHYALVSEVYSAKGDQVLDLVTAAATVTRTRAVPTVTLDARRATGRPSVSTPRPATPAELELGYVVTDHAGRAGVGAYSSVNSGRVTLVSPQPPLGTGHAYWVSFWELASPAGVAPYSYDLLFVDNGIPADQHHTATGLATVRATYYTDGPSRQAAALRLAYLPIPVDLSSSIGTITVPTPGRRTEYVSTAAGVRWLADVIANPTRDNPLGGDTLDDLRRYRAGSTYDAEWFRGPLAANLPRPSGVTAPDQPGYCGNCRRPGSMSVDIDPAVDSDGHLGSITYSFADDTATPHTHFRLYRDGTLIGENEDDFGGVVPVPAARATYRVIFGADRSTSGFVGSTHSTLDETFVSAAGAGRAVPASWSCPAKGDGRCRALPLLRVRVPLPETLDGRLPLGRSTIAFTVDHAAGAAATAITRAGLQTKADGASTWTTAPVKALGHGRFAATVDNTRAGAGVSMRITATDAGGTTMSQSTTDAYFVAAA